MPPPPRESPQPHTVPFGALISWRITPTCWKQSLPLPFLSSPPGECTFGQTSQQTTLFSGARCSWSWLGKALEEGFFWTVFGPQFELRPLPPLASNQCGRQEQAAGNKKRALALSSELPTCPGRTQPPKLPSAGAGSRQQWRGSGGTQMSPREVCTGHTSLGILRGYVGWGEVRPSPHP